MQEHPDGDFGFTRDRNAGLALRAHLNPLPRSVTRPTAYVSLDGEWRFDVDTADVGLSEQWFLGHEYHSTASWPGSIEKHLASLRESRAAGSPWRDEVVVWYERDFELPARWVGAGDRLSQLTFGACGYETRVWLNGHPLQTIEGELVHLGEWTSFSYELPPELLRRRNRLTVRIADSLDAEVPRGKQESRVYMRGGIWYQTISGAVRSVWIEPVDRNRLRSRLGVISTVEDRLVEFNVRTRVRDSGAYRLRLVVAPRESEEPLAVREFPLELMPGEKAQRITLHLPAAELWSPENPQLYHLVAQLVGPDGRASQIETHFGLRKVEARGRYVYLNNEAVYLDGILYQPAAAGFEQMRRHMLSMKELGCNLVRVHVAGIDPRVYDLADELGMLLWVEVPSPHSSTERSRANHWMELTRMLALIGSHPSVIIWSLYNEDWGAEDIASSRRTQRYISGVYAYMRLNHPQVLVVDNDGWHHVSTEGRLESHLLTAHVYTPRLTEWRLALDHLSEGNLQEVAVNPLVVGDPFFYQGQVPLVVSEWGGFGFSGYGGPGEPATKAARIRAFKAELRARPIAGDVYTQATSIEEEVNGLIDPESGELLVPAGLLCSQDREIGAAGA